jgi:hypothetical protein
MLPENLMVILRSYCFVDVILDFPQEKRVCFFSAAENMVQEIILLRDGKKYLKGNRKNYHNAINPQE